jgi:hypothetical protein
MFSKTKIALSAALILGTASAALAENNAVPGERNPNPVASQVFEGRNAYEGRAQIGTQTPSIYVEKNVFDRATQSFGAAL